MIFDIRTPERARETLVRMTDVPLDVWTVYGQIQNLFSSTDELIKYVVEMYQGHLPENSDEFEYVFFQITTSANECQSILRNGLLNLQEAYSLPDSELREYLDAHGIIIDLQERILRYGELEYDITYTENRPDDDTLEYKCWSVGEKFYHDFAICGFLSVWERCEYGGLVHRRPEILFNIDELLGTTLSQEWEETHSAFDVIVKVSDDNVFSVADVSRDELGKVRYCLQMAFKTAFGDTYEEIIVLKDGVRIQPSSILGIEECDHWNY